MGFFKVESKKDVEFAKWNIKDAKEQLIKLKDSMKFYKSKIRHFKLELDKYAKRGKSEW